MGLVGLLGLYWHFGVLADFVQSIRHHTAAAGNEEYNNITGFSGTTAEHLARIFRSFADRSTLCIALAGLAIGAYRLTKGSLGWRAPVALGFASFFLVSAGVAAIGVFPIYYWWMNFVPLTICVASEFDSLFCRRESVSSQNGSCRAVFVVGAARVAGKARYSRDRLGCQGLPANRYRTCVERKDVFHCLFSSSRRSFS